MKEPKFKVSITVNVSELSKFLTKYPHAEIKVVENNSTVKYRKAPFKKTSFPHTLINLGATNSPLSGSQMIAKQAIIKALAGRKSATRANLTTAVKNAFKDKKFAETGASSVITFLLHEGHLSISKDSK